MRMNAVIGSMTLALTATILTACGGGGGGGNSATGYCTELKADKAYFESLSGSGSSSAALDALHCHDSTLRTTHLIRGNVRQHRPAGARFPHAFPYPAHALETLTPVTRTGYETWT